MAQTSITKYDRIALILLVVITFGVFGQVASHAFLNYDDGQFIYENPHVSQGLTGSSVAWALTSAEIGYYPITWLSHELDVQLFGMKPGAHLLMNAAIHAITTCLLFFALRALLGDFAVALFVAALFAIHPMHVESVAWVSERKDTMSTLFAVIALLLYARNPRNRIGVALAMVLSLAAKQMYVTLPFIFLLLDYWPMKRLDDIKQRVIEKLPLFALSIIGGAIAVVGQRNLNAIQSSATNPLGARVANALVAYVRYLSKLFVPIHLAAPYPLERFSTATVAAAALLLLAITVGAVILRNRMPQLIVGWLWFLGTLVPVIGIISLGAQSMADRYSYFAYLGLFIAIACSIPRKTLPVAGVAITVLMAALAFRQVGYWKNSETLFRHTLAVTPANPVAEYSYGQALQLTNPDEAIPHFQRSIGMSQEAHANPDWLSQAHVGLGTSLLMKARPIRPGAQRTQLIKAALSEYQQALVIDPNAPHAKNNIALADQMLRADFDEEINNALALLRQGKIDSALELFRHAVAVKPDSAAAHIYLAIGLIYAHSNHDAAEELRTAKSINSTLANEYSMRALHTGIDEAIARTDAQK